MSPRYTWTLALAALSLGFSSPALAQDEGGEEEKTVYKKDQVINFEGLDVQGEIKKPAGAYLLERKKSKFSPLIKFRQNWDDEAVRSLEQKK